MLEGRILFNLQQNRVIRSSKDFLLQANVIARFGHLN
jgi:hypothetical protein